jgi:hypothetical protein
VRKRLHPKLLAAAVCGTAVLAVSGFTAVPVAHASAAHTSPVPASATAQTHTIAIHIRIMPRDGKQSTAPRVACGGANAWVQWHSGPYPWVKSWGESWDNCGAGTYTKIFLSYYDPAYNNIPISTAGPHSTVGFNTGTRSTGLNPGHIGIAACQHAPGWSCGATIHVGGW